MRFDWLGFLGLRDRQLGCKEASPEPGGLPFVYLLKTLIPVMAVLLALQALAQIARALTTLRQRDNA